MNSANKTQRNLQQRIRRGLAAYSANRHLRAYALARDPWHVVDAYLEYRRLDPRVPEPLLAALASALMELRRSPRKPPRTNAVRDLELVALVLALERTNPDRPPEARWTRTRLLARIGEQHRLSLPAMKMLFKRAQDKVRELQVRQVTSSLPFTRQRTTR